MIIIVTVRAYHDDLHSNDLITMIISRTAILKVGADHRYCRIVGSIGGELNLAAYITTAKLKSANILAIAILGSTAKFNSRQ